MPTDVSVNKPPGPDDRTRALATGGTVVGIVVLVAVGLVWLVVGTIYLSSLVGLNLRGTPSISAAHHTV
jgi:hypothetical protein